MTYVMMRVAINALIDLEIPDLDAVIKKASINFINSQIESGAIPDDDQLNQFLSDEMRKFMPSKGKH